MKKILFAALAATALFASCAKEGNGPDDNGADAKMSLAITFPQTETRATDDKASVQDVKVEYVTVFIYKADGTGATGNGTTFNDIATQFEISDNVYTLNEANRIATTSGSKKIYVGINLPAALRTDIPESTLINAYSTENLWSTTSVAMLSKGEIHILAAQEEGTSPTKNEVVASVERLVAKIAVQHGALSYDIEAPADSEFTVTPDAFTVGNRASSFYPVQRIETSKLVTPMEPVFKYAGANNRDNELPMKELNANNITDLSTLSSTFYVPEHTTNSEYLRKTATYAVVRGKLEFTHLATVENDVITLTPVDAGDHTGDLHVVIQGGNTYFCANQDIATEVYNVLPQGARTQIYQDAGETEGEYYTFYYVFINKNVTTDPLSVYRNQFIHYTIDGIGGIGVPGQPGEPKNPPITIPDPEEPVFESNAYLRVIVNIKPWSYIPYDNLILE